MWPCPCHCSPLWAARSEEVNSDLRYRSQDPISKCCRNPCWEQGPSLTARTGRALFSSKTAISESRKEAVPSSSTQGGAGGCNLASRAPGRRFVSPHLQHCSPLTGLLFPFSAKHSCFSATIIKFVRGCQSGRLD